jgi:hypothetical protein
MASSPRSREFVQAEMLDVENDARSRRFPSGHFVDRYASRREGFFRLRPAGRRG